MKKGLVCKYTGENKLDDQCEEYVADNTVLWSNGIDNMTYTELYRDIEKGGKFVVYTYVISVIFVTFRRSTNIIHYVKSSEASIKFGWPYLLVTLFCGWWGLPYGPVYSIGSIYTAFTGKDVTVEVLNEINNRIQQ